MKVKVVGTALIITSTLKVAQVEAAKNFAPDALKVFDDEGNQVYAVATGETASIGKFGTTFNGADAEGNLQATVVIDNAADKKKYVTEQYGLAIAGLAQAETLVAEEIESVLATVNGALSEMEVE